MILFFDTETTGKADFRADSSAPHQPRLVQLGVVATSDDGKDIFHEANVIVRPEGFVIPDEAASIHGVTQEIAEAVGVPLIVAVSLFSGIARRSSLIVAFNSDFDCLILKRELHALGKRDKIDGIFEAPVHCAMKATTSICKLPGPYGYKWPKLTEAHQHFFGCGFEGAHDALADVRATIKVHFATVAALAPPVTTDADPQTETKQQKDQANGKNI